LLFFCAPDRPRARNSAELDALLADNSLQRTAKTAKLDSSNLREVRQDCTTSESNQVRCEALTPCLL
jgi:hypothetical protein